MSQRERVKRAYLQKKGQLPPQPQRQPQPTPTLDDILWLMEQEREAKQLRKPRGPVRKALDVLRKAQS